MRAIAQPFDPRRDLAIIACQRRLSKHDKRRRVVGVRWASRPDLGFPPSGYIVRRRGVEANAGLGVFWLPSTKSWEAFRDDAEKRRPLAGPYFPSIERENLGHLLPIVRLADPRTPVAEHEELTRRAAAFFGEIHAGDAALAWNLWPFRASPPPLDELLADAAARAPIVSYYWRRATDYLLALALRFEYAVLFGLATDDAPPERGTVMYVVGAAWRQVRAVARTDWKTPNSACVVPAPAWLTAERAPGSVAHPAFAAWPDWVPPPELAPIDGDGSPMPAASIAPRAPASFSALTWADAAPEPALIGHGPVLYRLSRFSHGRQTAGHTVPPPLPPGASFEPLVDGEDLLRSSSEPNFLDLPGMAWPPLEGHYVYSVRGVNLLGVVSEEDAQATLRHHDDLRPMAPRARSLSDPAVVIGPDGAVVVRARVDWDAREDFASPDVASFRVAASWIATTTTTLRVLSVANAGPLHVDLSIEQLSAAPDAFAGARLSTTVGDFPIVSHATGTAATMRVRRVAGRSPRAEEHGIVISAASPTARTRIAELRRRPAVAATVDTVPSLAPLEVRLRTAGIEPLPVGEPARIYLHLLRATFDAEPTAAGWRIAEPEEEDPARPIWERWLAIGDPAGALRESPALMFPRHELEVRVVAPPSFDAGLLELSFTSADAAHYVPSPPLPAVSPALLGLRGNESSPTAAMVSVRGNRLPSIVVATGDAPGAVRWATSAAVFDEGSAYTLRWAATAGATRYEVWRAVGATDPAAFDLRGIAFGTSYVDRLPGRAPTRAFYRVRGFGTNGLPGPFSAIIGPVHVPDVRPPARPNLLRAAAIPEPGTVAIEWTQPGDVDGVRFEIERIEADAVVAGVVSAGTSPGAGGVYRYLDSGLAAGRTYQYRVTPYREVAAPIDPSGAAKRDIAGPRSVTRSATAVGLVTLPPPQDVAAAVDASTRVVALTWTNPTAYASITIRRRLASAYVFETVARVAGDAVTFVDVPLAPGTWRYQVRGHEVRREARSDEIEVVVP